jgi:hypothetical protein
MGMGRLRVMGVGALALFVISGCGGGARQDAKEPSGTFPVEIVTHHFPLTQHIAQQSQLRITVRNAGTKTIPNLAVTVKGLSIRDTQPGLADPNRPVWIIDSGPRGGDTAYVGTWALGAVRPHATRTFTWRLTPTKTGVYDVHYEVAAGLNGKAKARTSDGGRPAGSFTIHVSGKPADARVDPKTGRVVRSYGN